MKLTIFPRICDREENKKICEEVGITWGIILRKKLMKNTAKLLSILLFFL
jgi:hypothetical protein